MNLLDTLCFTQMLPRNIVKHQPHRLVTHGRLVIFTKSVLLPHLGSKWKKSWFPKGWKDSQNVKWSQSATGWIDLCSPSLLGCLFAAPCGAPRALRVQHYGYRAPAASAASRWHGTEDIPLWVRWSQGDISPKGKSYCSGFLAWSHIVEFTRIHPDIWCCLILIVSENYCRNEEWRSILCGWFSFSHIFVLLHNRNTVHEHELGFLLPFSESKLWE